MHQVRSQRRVRSALVALLPLPILLVTLLVSIQLQEERDLYQVLSKDISVMVRQGSRAYFPFSFGVTASSMIALFAIYERHEMFPTKFSYVGAFGCVNMIVMGWCNDVPDGLPHTITAVAGFIGLSIYALFQTFNYHLMGGGIKRRNFYFATALAFFISTAVWLIFVCPKAEWLAVLFLFLHLAPMPFDYLWLPRKVHDRFYGGDGPKKIFWFPRRIPQEATKIDKRNL